MEFLLEINTEEMPASHVKSALNQLRERFEAELTGYKIPIHSLVMHGTCRRLVMVGGFASHQKDQKEEIIGPPKAVAFTEEGKPSPAALGFAKAQGVEAEQLVVIKTERGQYVGLRKTEKGRPTPDILQEVIPRIFTSLSFPKMMRWEKEHFRFSRPIRNILCLGDKKILSVSVGGIEATDFTFGHPIHSPQKIRVKAYSEYKSELRKNKVVIEEQERRKMILNQIAKILTSEEAQLFPDEALLEKLTYEVEFPYVFLGSFPKEYLSLPLEVLSTAMREGQSLFSVIRGKKQLSYFLGVADNYHDPKDLIKKGNERVLKARLDDAKFFWEQDRKVSLKKRMEELRHLLFQERLGTYEDKTHRLKKIAAYILDRVDQKKHKKDVILAAELSKADLLTEMVREFPTLQGKVGALYAREEGYPSHIWKAIYEHYQPLSLEQDSPHSLLGGVLSIADKLDSIIGVVGIGIQMTGSKDPFGLRRNALGVCKIILDKKMSLSLSRLLDKVIRTYGDRLELPKDEIKNYCFEFFFNRLQYIYERSGFRYDLVKAALGAADDNVYHSFLRLKALDSLKESSHFEPMILIAKRVNNILRGQPRFKINPDLFVEKEEKELYSSFAIIKKNILPLISSGEFTQAQRFIFRMRSIIHSFFDNVLVMADDKRIRRNRLALLQEISELLLLVADYSQVVVEG